MKHLLPLALLLTACSTTNTRFDDVQQDDAGMDAVSIDATPEAFVDDAGLDTAFHGTRLDAFRWDAFRPDAWRVGDAYGPDAVPLEQCNGRDDDFDMRVDEEASGPLCSPTTLCVAGRCECLPGRLACDPATPDLCVSDFTTREHCGGCAPCSPSEDCSSDGAPRCVPARIIDFTAATETSGITCIVREDRHLVCRYDDAWFDMEMRAVSVRAWGDTLCVLSDSDYHVHCRGPDDSRLLVGDRVSVGTLGWYRLRVPVLAAESFGFSIEGGEGILVAGGDTIVWGGRYARREPRYLTGEFTRALGDGTRRFVLSSTRGVITFRTWGEPHPTLSSLPWEDNIVGGARRVIETIDAGFGADSVARVACYHDYCCALFVTGQLRCWGGPGTDADLVEIPLAGLPLTRYEIRVFPSPEGVRMCIGEFCTLIEHLYDTEPPPLELDPRRYQGTISRSDWRADCARTPEGGFDCIGMHSGWPLP